MQVLSQRYFALLTLLVLHGAWRTHHTCRYMGHFSRYVPPGSHRVNVTNPLDPTGNGGDAKGAPDGSLEVFAARTPDDQVAVVAMNRNDDPITFRLRDAATGQVSSANLTVKAHSVHTYWYAASAQAGH